MVTVAAILVGLNDWELGLLTALGLALTLLTGSLLPRVKTPEAKRGIVSLQFARTGARARALVDAWDRRGMLGSVRRNLLLDFPFLVAYSTALALACLLAARAAPADGFVLGDADDVGAAVALAALVAGALDAAENVAMLDMLDPEAHISDSRARAVTVLAAVKFALIGVAIIWIVVALVAGI